MKTRSNFSQWFIVALSLLATTALAETHFMFTTNTGNNMTVLVRTSIQPTLNGSSLAKGDEIGIFSTACLCVGAVVWNDSNLAITVWGDNERTSEVDGIAASDTLRFRVWDVSSSQEITSKTSYSLGGPVYTADGVAILASFEAKTPDTLPPCTPVVNTANIALKPNMQTKYQTKPIIFTLFDIQGKILFKSTCNGMQAAESMLSSNKPCLSKSQYIISFESNGSRQFRKMTIKQ